jgi:hypothetical protein
MTTKEKAAANSTCNKLTVQWLNGALCFVSCLLLADSLVFLNPLFSQARNRYTLKKSEAETSTSLFLIIVTFN